MRIRFRFSGDGILRVDPQEIAGYVDASEPDVEIIDAVLSQLHEQNSPSIIIAQSDRDAVCAAVLEQWQKTSGGEP